MFLTKLTVGELQTNCYILALDKEALVIDPGAEPLNILGVINQNKLQLKWIINTHCHYDHITANPDLVEKTNCQVYMHKKDIPLLSNPVFNLSAWFSDVPQNYQPTVLEEGSLKLGNLELEVFHTPGHTPGSVCLKCDNYLFTGDLLFRDSVGRVDFPTSSEKDMVSSLEKIKQLDDSLIVLPGHGEQTTLGREKKSNPFMAE